MVPTQVVHMGVPQMLPYFIAAKGPLGWFRLRL
jgi:hypothetical protein